MADYEALSRAEVARRLTELPEKVAVLMHANPDGDTTASAAALCLALSALGKEAGYLCADKIPERLEFIMDGAWQADSLEGYTVVSVDVASRKQMGALADIVSPILMIDHHEVGEPFADNLIAGGMSSCAEVVYEILLELEKISDFKISLGIATALYAGISSDTGSFRYSCTSPDTMRRAASLIEMGVDFSAINHKLFFAKSIEEIKAEGIVANSIKTAYDGKVAYAEITLSDAEAAGGMAGFECAVDIVRSLRGVSVAFVVKEKAKGIYKISLRSTGADVAFISKRFGGGGHTRAAGCTVEAESCEAVSGMILDALRNVVDE
jgi:phosphoesterase RecJ-like protein